MSRGSPVAAPAPPARVAGLARRFAALLYELLLLVAMLFIASFLLTPLVSPGTAANAVLVVPSPLGRAISFAALFTLCGAFFVWSWSRGRRTLPMKTWHLALVTTADEPLTRSRALVRYLAAWIGPAVALAAYTVFAPHGLAALAWPLMLLNWLAAFVDPERQFLHDRVAGTRLVRVGA